MKNIVVVWIFFSNINVTLFISVSNILKSFFPVYMYNITILPHVILICLPLYKNHIIIATYGNNMMPLSDSQMKPIIWFSYDYKMRILGGELTFVPVYIKWHVFWRTMFLKELEIHIFLKCLRLKCYNIILNTVKQRHTHEWIPT